MLIDQDRVPATVVEAIKMFWDALEEPEKQSLKDVDEDQLVVFHHTLGEDIRNAWTLTDKNSILVNQFKELGVSHADDISGIILTSVYRKLHKKPLNLKGQVAKFKKYWMNEIGKEMPE